MIINSKKSIDLIIYLKKAYIVNVAILDCFGKGISEDSVYLLNIMLCYVIAVHPPTKIYSY